MSYHILTSKSIKEFLQNIPSIRDYFDDKNLISQEIGDGNLNFVFIVKSQKNPKKSSHCQTSSSLSSLCWRVVSTITK